MAYHRRRGGSIRIKSIIPATIPLSGVSLVRRPRRVRRHRGRGLWGGVGGILNGFKDLF